MLLLRTGPELLASGALVLAPHIAAAHVLAPGEPPSSGFVWEPWAVASLYVAGLLYWRGVVRLGRRNPRQRILTRSRKACFAAGLLAVAAALLSPIDAIAAQLFSMHMLQHVILLLVAPPLLVWSRPAIAMLWALPLAWRKRVGRVWVTLGLGRGLTTLMQPLSVWILFTGAVVFWHLPGPYGWASRSDALHIFEHASFFAAALAFWSLVIEPSGRRRMGDGACLLFIAGNGMLTGLPGALMMLAPRPLFPTDAAVVASWGLTPLADQQLAGAVMWILAGFVYLGAALLVALRWLGTVERPLLAASRGAHFLPLILLPALLLAGCDDSAAAAAKLRVGGDAKRGTELIRAYGCAGCHTIPGIAGADGLVGPPLTSLSRRAYLAGLLVNTPENLVAWLRAPQTIVPGNVMPDMGLSEGDARDIATYLYTIK
jgi:putative membrane protein